jgi:hypothetical protein
MIISRQNLPNVGLPVISCYSSGPDGSLWAQWQPWTLSRSKTGTDGRTWSPRSIGMKLHHLRGRAIGGKCPDRNDTRDGTAVWTVRTSNPGTTGTTGTSPALRAHGREHTRAHETPTGAGNSPLSPASPLDTDLTPEDQQAVEEFLSR